MNREKGRQLPDDKKNRDQQRAKRHNQRFGLTLVKIVSIPLLLIVSLMAGLMIGYGVLGKQPVLEVFHFQTYKHMYDLIFSGT